MIGLTTSLNQVSTENTVERNVETVNVDMYIQERYLYQALDFVLIRFFTDQVFIILDRSSWVEPELGWTRTRLGLMCLGWQE